MSVEEVAESFRIYQFSLEQNEKGLRANLDLIDELCDKAFAKQLAHQQKV